MRSAVSQPFRPSPGEVHRYLDQSPRLLPLCITFLRSGDLSSTRVTGLQRYYVPIRHLPEPSASLAGQTLRRRLPHCPRIPTGFPRSVGFRFHACCHHYPGGTDGTVSLCLPSAAAFPVIMAGRLPRQPFEACSVFTTRCGPHGSLTLSRGLFWEYFSSFVTSCSRSQCFWLERYRQPGLSPGEPQRLVEAYIITLPKTPSAPAQRERRTSSSSAHLEPASAPPSSTPSS